MDKVQNGIKTIQAFDSSYYKFGDAFQIKSKGSGKSYNGILLYCKNDRLIFSIVDYDKNSSNRVSDTLYIEIEDLETTEIKKLVVEDA